jgi:hypothetical protein
MIRLLTLVVVAISLLSFYIVFSAGKAEEGAKEPKTLTILSEPVDPACYISKGLKGEGHKTCAMACHKAGQSLALLSDDGSLFFTLEGDPGTSPDEKLVPFIGTKVKVTGKVFESGGTKGMVVEKVEPVK